MPVLDFTIPFAPYRPQINLTGQLFGRLTVLSIHSPDTTSKRRDSRWLCKCQCGTFFLATARCLRQGNTQSCGCLQRDRMREGVTTHGQSHTTEYRIWQGLKHRCSDPNYHGYARYGGRGIECKIQSLEELIQIVGKRPSMAHTLDRIDNDGHYEKGNLRWASRVTQQRNRHTTRFLTVNGVSKPLIEWAGSQRNDSKIRARLRAGWCNECAVHNAPFVKCVHK